ncbi:hypothetical protein [Methylotenera sp.]|uniref:hypothetical protein n=1 Tax=Methylotenera sp. TaxID=2051956 RepID=UPI002488277D|nr:hypothetical protein [Methylotenera sp.]MDI1362554.1 hypothetical protein [Methylotenera sp.]
MKLHGRDIKEGDEVWSLTKGWIKVLSAEDLGDEYPIETDRGCFTADGRDYSDDLFPSLFWNEMEITVKPQPDYEWQYVYTIAADCVWETTLKHYKTEADFLDAIKKPYQFQKLEISKKEVANE